MTNDNKKLITKSVTIYLDGGWELSGVILRIEDNKIIVKNETGNYLIFKNKVCCILTDATDPVISSRETPKNFEDNAKEFVYGDLGMHIPLGMLSEKSRKELSSDDDFSMKFDSKKRVSNSSTDDGIVFRLEDDSKE